MALRDDRTSAFKSSMTGPARLAKADQTTEAARAIVEAETKRRDAKTARLRELRLAREAAEAAEKAAAPAAPKKKAKAKASA